MATDSTKVSMRRAAPKKRPAIDLGVGEAQASETMNTLPARAPKPTYTVRKDPFAAIARDLMGGWDELSNLARGSAARVRKGWADIQRFVR